MMKNRKIFQIAALMMAFVMVLGLAACGGSGSDPKVQHSDLFGSWASDDMLLTFLEDFPGVAFMAYIENPGEVVVYGYTIEGNVVKLELEPDESGMMTDAPAEMKMTMKSGRLEYGNAVFNTISLDLDGAYEQPAASEPATNVTEPMQTEPAQTNTPTSSAGITGIWQDGPSVFAFCNDYALAYVFGSGDDGNLRFAYLKDLYDCSYTLSGDTLSLSVFEMDGTPVNSAEFTLDGNTLSNGISSLVKVSENNGVEGDLSGTWHSMGDEFQFGALTGTRMEFYNDGSFRICQEDGSEQQGGTYTLTSQYDLPAVTLSYENGAVMGTYCYEFLENDLLMIYVYDVDLGGYVFYR